MPIDLYLMTASAPCRAVQLTAKALGLDINLKETNLMKGEQMKPEFLKLNPQHTIPTLVDDGFSIWESRAIITYLVNKYGKGSTLYPEEPKARAVVDQRLYFDIGTLYQRFGEYFYPQFLNGQPADPQKLEKVEEALKLLDVFLDGLEYVAGPNLTVADLSIVSTVSTFEIADIDFRKYPNVKRWYERIISDGNGFKEIIEKGVEEMKKLVEEKKRK